MTFAAKHNNAFQGEEKYQLIPRRSEGRLKKLDSASDTRAWSIEEQERKEHLFELILKQPRRCSATGTFIPLDALLKMIKVCGGNQELTDEERERLMGPTIGEGAQADLGADDDELKRYADEAMDRLALLDNVCGDRDSLQKALECAETEIDSLRHSCDLSEAALRTLKCEMNEFESEALKEKNEECECLREECQALLNEIEELQSSDRMGQVNEQFDGLKSELCKVRKQLANACGEIEKQRCVIENLITERNMLRMKTTKANDEEIQKLKKSAEESEKLRYQKCTLEEKLDELRHVEKQLILANTKLCEMEKIRRERDEFERKYKAVLQLKEECEALKKQFTNTQEIEKQNKELVEKNKRCQYCLDEKEKETKRLIMEVKKLTTARDDGQKQIELALAKLCTEMDKKNAQLNQSSVRLVGLQGDMEKAIGKIRCEAKDLKIKLTDLEEEVDDLRKRLKEKTKKIEILVSQIEEKDKTIHCLNDQMKKKDKARSNYNSKNGCYSHMGDQLRNFAEDAVRMEHCAFELNNVTDDKHLLELLEQSKCTVNRLSNELRRKYKC